MNTDSGFTQGGQSSNCSGTLLNSSGDISIPYFLSAWHCIPNQAAASTLETDWFFEANSCNSSVPGKSWFTAAGEVGGAELLFSSSQTDVSFMKLNRTPNNPYTPVTYLTYSGWTTAQIPSNRRVTSISHPRADLKKVAKGQTFVGTKFCKPKIRADGTMFFSCEAAYNYAIGIPLEGGDYKEVGFDTGDVFTGSSGSGLFLDDAQLLAGTQSHLSKDTNTCGIATAGYGAFNVSYAIGNLGKWLNPDPSTFAPKNLKMSFGGTDEIDRHAYT
jgi:lysyl endopeptidase